MLFEANRTTAMFALLLLSVSIISSCSKKDKKEEMSSSGIIGTWYFNGSIAYFQPNGSTEQLNYKTEEPNPAKTIQFKSDGTFIYKFETGAPEPGQYTLTGNNLYMKYNNAEMGEGNVTILQLDKILVYEYRERYREADTPNGSTGSGARVYKATYKKK
ncbi:hypothetical protein GCM10027516_35430 [Niabella aquatica]